VHKLLAKQLQKAGLLNGEVDLARLTELVALAYEEAEKDRERTDRSITLMVEELDAFEHGLEATIARRTAELRDSRRALKLQNRRMAAALDSTGYAIAIFFSIAAALRLARFNVRAHTGEPGSYFLGLPVPAAAGILASFVLSYELFGSGTMTSKTIPMLMKRMPIFFHFIPLCMMILAFLMVSNVHYGTFKQMKLGRPKSIQNLILLMAGILLIFTYPQNMIFIVFSLYVLSGLIGLAVRFYHAQRAKRMARQFGRRSTDVLETDGDGSRTPMGRPSWIQKK